MQYGLDVRRAVARVERPEVAMLSRLLLLGLLGLASTTVVPASVPDAPAKPVERVAPRAPRVRHPTSAYAILATPGAACSDEAVAAPCDDADVDADDGEPSSWRVTPGLIVP